ncbi:MAG TPA: SDR family oxidoreductase, partial [Longimicrobium sp.]|nr:SDR family oxidoreductase [Longimicrobium sp.]
MRPLRAVAFAAVHPRPRVHALPSPAMLPIFPPGSLFPTPRDDDARAPVLEAYAGVRVLLTGATGFIGAYLLAQLLATTRASVHCLVRCADPQ